MKIELVVGSNKYKVKIKKDKKTKVMQTLLASRITGIGDSLGSGSRTFESISIFHLLTESSVFGRERSKTIIAPKASL